MILLFLKAWIVIGWAVLAPTLVAALVLFCRGKGTWRERLRMFGGGT